MSTKLQLSMDQFRVLFPEGSELEASLAAGTLVNFSDKIAKTIANRILTAAGQQAEQIAVQASNLTHNSLAEWSYNKNSFVLKPEIKKSIEAAASEAIRGEAKAAIDKCFAEEEITTRINRIIENSLLGFIDKKMDACIVNYAKRIDINAAIGAVILDRLKG